MARTEPRVSWVSVPSDDELPDEVNDLCAKAGEKIGFVPNVLRAFALRPDHLLLWEKYYAELLRGESGLSHAQREMIAVVVSTINRCHYCVAAHGAALRVLVEDPVFVDTLVVNFRYAELEPRDRAMLDFAVKVTNESHQCTEEDVDALRAVGWSDQDIFDIAQVAATFNLTNRLASALGWRPNPEYFTLGR